MAHPSQSVLELWVPKGSPARCGGTSVVELQPEGWPEAGSAAMPRQVWTLGRHFLEASHDHLGKGVPVQGPGSSQWHPSVHVHVSPSVLTCQ